MTGSRGIEAKAKASGLRRQGQGQTFSRSRPRRQFFVLELSSSLEQSLRTPSLLKFENWPNSVDILAYTVEAYKQNHMKIFQVMYMHEILVPRNWDFSFGILQLCCKYCKLTYLIWCTLVQKWQN